MSSPPTPRTLIQNVLGELHTAQPVKQRSKRRRSSTSTASRRQSMNNSTLRKQALLSSANRTESANVSNDGELTPRSQIQGFLDANKTGVPVARQKRRTTVDNETSMERPPKRTSFLDVTEETPRTMISNLLDNTETGMTAAPAKHWRKIHHSPNNRSRRENVSYGNRSSGSDSSLLDVTIRHKGNDVNNLGRVPQIRPSISSLKAAMQQLASQPSISLTSPSSYPGTTVDISGSNNLDNSEQADHISDSTSETQEQSAAVPDLSTFYRSGSDQQVSVAVGNQINPSDCASTSHVNASSVVNQEPHIDHSESTPTVDQSKSSMDHSSMQQHSQRELFIPKEVPFKPRVQLEIPFPVIGKQITAGAAEVETKQTRKHSGRAKRDNIQNSNSKLNLPRSLTKSIFCHFSKCKNITSGALDEIEKVSSQFWQQFSYDVQAFADHAGRVSVTEKDVELLMRRQGFVTDNQSMYTLVEKYLPMEYREQIIPVAKAGNKVIPKK